MFEYAAYLGIQFKAMLIKLSNNSSQPKYILVSYTFQSSEHGIISICTQNKMKKKKKKKKKKTTVILMD